MKLLNSHNYIAAICVLWNLGWLVFGKLEQTRFFLQIGILDKIQKPIFWHGKDWRKENNGFDFQKHSNAITPRVARWFLCRPKIPIWVNFGEPWKGKCCYIPILIISNILVPLGIFYGNFVAIWL
jgi:hypothetical protein